MPKRDPEIEPVEKSWPSRNIPPVGEQLRVAREAKGMSLEDVAAQTTIPQRHLASIETAHWDTCRPRPIPPVSPRIMPRQSGSTGPRSATSCAKRWAASASPTMHNDVFEPADPARTMPKSLVLGAIVAVVVLVAVMSWLNQRALDQTDQPVAGETNTRCAGAPPPATRNYGEPLLTRKVPSSWPHCPGLAAGKPEGWREPVSGNASAGSDLYGPANAPLRRSLRPASRRP